MVKGNLESIVTTRHWLVGPPVSLYSFFFHRHIFISGLGNFSIPGPKTEGRERDTHCRGGGGSSTWRVGAARCHLIAAQLITSHSITDASPPPPPARPSLFQPPLLTLLARPKRHRAPATPTPLALVEPQPPTPPTATTRTSSAIASSCLLLPACLRSQSLAFKPFAHSHTQYSHCEV